MRRPEAFVRDYRGVIIADAPSTHGAGARGSPNIVLAACWAHVNRHVIEPLVEDDLE